MKKLVLVGGGGHCKSVLDAALAMKEYDEIVITDACLDPETVIMGCRVVGNDDVLPELRKNGFKYAFVTVGSIKSTSIRRKLVERLEGMGFQMPVICDPSAVVSTFAQIGEGTYVGKNVTINADSRIGKHCIINTGAIIEHECSVGDFSHVSVGATLCGDCDIETDCLIGAGSTVIQGVSVGSNSVIGAGALVNRNIDSDCTVVGVPARKVGSS